MAVTEAAVETEAFNTLFTTRRPVAVRTLARRLRASVTAVETALAGIERDGHLLRDPDGAVAAVAGLSVLPTRHEFVIAGVTRWTWCAWDALGLVTVTGRGGLVRSTSPQSGAGIMVRFDGRRVVPSPAQTVLLFADRPECCVTVRDWCPNVNLFESADVARAWMDGHDVTGELQDVGKAGRDCADYYWPLLRPSAAKPWWRGLLRAVTP
ncbi:MAG TPA: organomercurial lyase [Planosporangium sp.]|nr:organomercurial lyase [Planosporangium sp.]